MSSSQSIKPACRAFRTNPRRTVKRRLTVAGASPRPLTSFPVLSRVPIIERFQRAALSLAAAAVRESSWSMAAWTLPPERVNRANPTGSVPSSGSQSRQATSRMSWARVKERQSRLKYQLAPTGRVALSILHLIPAAPGAGAGNCHLQSTVPLVTTDN